MEKLLEAYLHTAPGGARFAFIDRPAPRGIRGGAKKMANHPNRRGKYELTFWGGVSKRYRRYHATLDAARETAHRVLAELENRAAHPAMIYCPECGRDGITIN